jgi:hypothetical protein
MMHKHRSFIVGFGLPAVALAGALVVIACQDSSPLLAPAPAHLRGDTCGGSGCVPPPTCITGKWTGGGRIDPTGDAARTAANDDAVDEPDGGQPPPPSATNASFITGKVTFGFNVFLGSDPSGQCIVNKGEIEVNGHALKLAWHVSIHDGVDAYDNRPVYATTFSDHHTGGVCLVVGTSSTNYMTARVNPQGGTELAQFEVCDNDRGQPQNSRSDAMRWRAQHEGDTGLTYLTGGNVVDHS